MRKRLIVILSVVCALSLGLAGLSACGPKKDESLLLHLTFDEGRGSAVKDAAGRQDEAQVQYALADAAYQSAGQDPQWRKKGVHGGSLLFDGYSNFIRYGEDEIRVSGSAFSVECWVAPRAFEWDDPNAAANGTEHLTAIVSQFSSAANQGFVLGYQRFGALSFQVGLGDRFVKVWSGEAALEKYEWNHVAATFDGAAGVARLYLNGALAGEETFYENAEIKPADDWLYVAKNSEGSSTAVASINMHSGLMDELKLYSRTLSEADVAGAYKSGLTDGKTPEIAFEDIWLQNVLTGDFHKTQYHGGPYQHWMNEPHAPMYYNGKYHLFFQFNPFGPYWRNICWGHLVSDDMVSWTPLKEVITPEKGTVAPDGIWSGGVAYDNDGVPALLFTAGNDSYRDTPGLISNQNIGLARPKDPSDPLLREWVVEEELALAQQVGQGLPGQFRDPHVWKEGDEWFMLVCSAKVGSFGGTALLYTTKDDSFMNWTYRGPVYEMANQPSDLGETWELPVMLPVQNEAGTVEKHVLIFSPAPADKADNEIFYFVGTFDQASYRFRPDHDAPRLLDYGNNVFTGPSGFIDPVTGRAVIFSIMQDQRKPVDQYLSGWAHSVGLAREIWLNDAGTDLKMAAVSELEGLHDKQLYSGGEQSIAEANAAIAGIGGDMLHIRLKMRADSAAQFGIRVRKNADGSEYTEFFYDTATGKVGVKTGRSGKQNISGTFSGALALEGGVLEADLYLDRSLIEAFFNETKSVSCRVYPKGRDSTGLEVFATGGEAKVLELNVYAMRSIY